LSFPLRFLQQLMRCVHMCGRGAEDDASSLFLSLPALCPCPSAKSLFLPLQVNWI
jgi:hypothetical protein